MFSASKCAGDMCLEVYSEWIIVSTLHMGKPDQKRIVIRKQGLFSVMVLIVHLCIHSFIHSFIHHLLCKH